MNALTAAGVASQSASEIPAGALLISSRLLLRSKQESGRCQGFSGTDGRSALARPLNGCAYSEAGLNFCSKAAQNIHIVSAAPPFDSQGEQANPAAATIDGMKVDLQDVTGIEPYPFAAEWEAYCPKSEAKLHSPSVVFQVVV